MSPNDTNLKPLVSVVIPTRNCVDYLPTALDSALSQDVDSLEVIVVDDGSSDGTWAWLQEQAVLDRRIKAVQTHGIGVSAARNAAIDQAKAPLVAFLDADDEWHVGKLARQLAFHLSNPRVVLSFTDYVHVNPAGDDLGCCFQYWPRFQHLAASQRGSFRALADGPAWIYAENVIGTSTVMARRDALQNAKGFDATLHSASDWDLWIRLALQGGVAYTPDVLMTYLMRPGSISSRSAVRLATMAQIMERHRKAIGRHHRWAIQCAEARLATGYAEHFRGSQHYAPALRADLRALYLAPSLGNARRTLADAWRALGQGTRRALGSLHAAQ